MKFFKYCYFPALLLWLTLFVYLQVSRLPLLRQCLLESTGSLASATSAGALLRAAFGCIPANQFLLTLSGLTALTLFLAISSLRQGYVSRMYQWLEQRGKEWVLALAIVALATLPYLGRGDVALSDAMQFSALSIYLKESLLSLSYPSWTFYWYLGSAPLAFYGWLYLLLAGIVSIVLPIDAANKVLFYVMHLGSVALIYLFIKSATQSNKAALIGALAFGLSFEHIARIMVGRSLTALTYLLTPLLFWIAELRMRERISPRRAIGLTALVAALLILNHQADALFILAILGAYTAARAVQTVQETGAKKLLAMAAELTASFGIALLLVSFWAVPMLLERTEASAAGKTAEIFLPHLPNIDTLKAFVSWPGLWGDKPLYYLGISILLLAGLGVLKHPQARKQWLVLPLLVSAIVVVLQSTRAAPALLLLFALSAGFGFIFLNNQMRTEQKRRLLLFSIIALLLIDSVPATIQLGYPDFSYLKAVYGRIDATDGERILDLSTDRRTFWPALVYTVNGKETVFGTLIESAPRSFPYAAAIASKAAQERYEEQKPFSEETLQAFYLIGVKHIIIHTEHIGKDPRKTFLEKRGALGLERELIVETLDTHSVVIASNTLMQLSYPSLLETYEGWNMRSQFEERSINTSEVIRIVQEVQLNRSTAIASQILIKESVNETLPPASQKVPLTLQVNNVQTQANKVNISYHVNQPSYLQLSYSHSKSLSVQIDGKPIPYWKTAINTIAIETEAGSHHVSIQHEPAKSPFLPLFLCSGIGLLCLVYLLTHRKI